jgi:hypothetical protein
VSRPSKHWCPRCGITLDGDWPCLTAGDAKGCEIAKAAGVKPRLRLAEEYFDRRRREVTAELAKQGR